MARLLRLCVLLFSIFLCLENRAQAPLRLDVDLHQDHPRLRWDSLSGGVYHVLSRESLSTGVWERAATIVSTNAIAEWNN